MADSPAKPLPCNMLTLVIVALAEPSEIFPFAITDTCLVAQQAESCVVWKYASA